MLVTIDVGLNIFLSFWKISLNFLDYKIVNKDEFNVLLEFFRVKNYVLRAYVRFRNVKTKEVFILFVKSQLVSIHVGYRLQKRVQVSLTVSTKIKYLRTLFVKLFRIIINVLTNNRSSRSVHTACLINTC